MQSATLDQLKTTHIFAEALRELESRQLDERRGLIAELGAINQVDAKELEEASKRDAELSAERASLNARIREIEGEQSTTRGRMWSSINRSSAARQKLIDQIKAGADPRIIKFMVWADRVRNLAHFAGFAIPSFEGALSSAAIEKHHKAGLDAGRKVAALCDKHFTRADQMRLEAISSDDVGLELASMATEIYAAYSIVPNARPIPENYEGALI